MTIPSTPASLAYLRENARELLNEFDAADALASYYLLHHDPRRTTLFMHRDGAGRIDGVLAHCQTGYDLFRPLVTLRLRGQGALPGLLDEGFVEGRPYILVAPPTYLERLRPYLELTEVSHHLILRLDASRYLPEMNVLVTRHDDKDGNPRAEIRRDKQVIASAGVNWRSPLFAEIFVQVQEEQRGRGFGRSVVSAVVAGLLKLGVTPVYSVAEANAASRAVAEAVGFVDTGAREVMAQAVKKSV